MNKRIIAVCLCCLLLFSVITMPARADDTISDGFYVDLCELFGYNTRSISNSGDIAYFDYPLSVMDINILAFDYEICVVASGAEPLFIGLTPDVDFEISNTVNGCFIRGTFDGQALDYVGLSFTADGPSNISILSFKIYLQRYLFSNFAAVVSSGYSTLGMSPGGSVTVASAPISDGIYTPVNYSIKVSKTYWADMDYMEFSFTLKCLSIDTISAYSTADNYLPIDISYVEQGYNTDSSLYDDQWFYVSGSVDLRSMDNVNTTGDIQILISCVGGPPQSSLTLTGLRGIHYSAAFNTNIYWFNMLAFLLSSGNEWVITSIDSGIESVVSAISSGLSPITSAITDFFKFDLDHIDDPALTNPLWGSIVYFLSDISQELKQEFFEIRMKFDDLIEVLSPDPVDQEVTDQMQQAGSELGGMTEQMQQAVTPPNVGDINVGYDDLVEPSGMSTANKIMSLFTTSSIIVSQLTIVFSMGLAGYVLFGKR